MITEFLKELKKQGYTQEKIEQITGITQSAISKLARGATPSLETVIKLADSFDTTTDEVLGRVKSDNANKQHDAQNHSINSCNSHSTNSDLF